MITWAFITILCTRKNKNTTHLQKNNMFFSETASLLKWKNCNFCRKFFQIATTILWFSIIFKRLNEKKNRSLWFDIKFVDSVWKCELLQAPTSVSDYKICLQFGAQFLFTVKSKQSIWNTSQFDEKIRLVKLE